MQKPASSKNVRLHVYKASAGSGKTHRLTEEYLILLFAAPTNYRHILAVTFTNKATDEMKSRIVQELYRLANGDHSPHLLGLQESTALDETTLRAKARTVLEALLHDYSAFAITTIDRFFQQTMRTFSREMGLSGSYNVDVDELGMLSKVVDLMLFELDKPENNTLKKWISAFMNEKIESGKSWRIHNEIEKLGKEIFKEKYKKLSPVQRQKIEDKTRLEIYKTQLFSITNAYVSELKTIGEKALTIIEKNQLHPADFTGSSRSQFFKFVAFAHGEIPDLPKTFLNFPDNLEAWSKKTAKKSTKIAIEQAYYDGLNDCVKHVISHYKNGTAYHTAQVILQNFNALGILNDIRSRLRLFQNEENTLFISDTTELLNQIIAESETPFIYEKIGTRIRHFMIDEFQDTSGMQWENFRPLLRESVASGNFNLIVGDAKQSIYRFRNSDWKLLEEQIPRDFSTEVVASHSLDTNWRSDAHIVSFNNAFFESAAHFLQQYFNEAMEVLPESDFKAYLSDKISSAYSEVYQYIPNKKSPDEGYVSIEFLPDTRENDWRTDALDRLPKTIEQLQDNGFALSDIAIVVRKNKEAKEVAASLLAYKEMHPDSPYQYDIISDEALSISSARSVKAAIALLRYFQQREDQTCKMLAVYAFYQFIEPKLPEASLHTIFSEEGIDFPELFRVQIEALEFLPIYEMAESFFALSRHAIVKEENAYMQAFLDLVLDFTKRESSNINDFLNWWDEKGVGKTLFSPEGQDALRLITIHKSKGLGFGVVVMPFIDWEIDSVSTGFKTNYIWCQPHVVPFDKIGIVPLRYTPKLSDTIFRADYFDERMCNFIDNLNLLYVAFTRTKHQFIGFAPRKTTAKDDQAIKNVAQLLWRAISHSKPSLNDEKSTIDLSRYLETKEDETAYFSLGNSFKKKAEKKTFNTSTLKITAAPSVPFANRLKMRLNAIGYFAEDGSRDYGTMMHQVMSQIETMDDIERVVEHHFLDGTMDVDEKKEMLRMLHENLSLPEVADWYAGNWQVMNEVQALHPRLGFMRPDRVMLGKNNEAIVVDYKFGETQDTKYIRQVQCYKAELEEMGYAPVRGFVFYVKLKKIEEV